MITARTVYGTIKTTLEAIPGVAAVFYQKAPDEVPTFPDSPYVQPYIILGLRVPRALEDRPVSELQTLDARIFRIQVQCVAADEDTLLDMTDAVITALTGLRIGGGQLTHAGDEEPVNPVLLDTEILPHRPYAPIFFRVATQ